MLTKIDVNLWHQTLHGKKLAYFKDPVRDDLILDHFL